MKLDISTTAEELIVSPQELLQKISFHIDAARERTKQEAVGTQYRHVVSGNVVTIARVGERKIEYTSGSERKKAQPKLFFRSYKLVCDT